MKLLKSRLDGSECSKLTEYKTESLYVWSEIG